MVVTWSCATLNRYMRQPCAYPSDSYIAYMRQSDSYIAYMRQSDSYIATRGSARLSAGIGLGMESVIGQVQQGSVGTLNGFGIEGIGAFGLKLRVTGLAVEGYFFG